LIHCFDVRNGQKNQRNTKTVWTLQAHDESVSSFDINPTIPGFLVTGSTDKEVKLWNVDSAGPSMVVSRNLDVGKVFSTAFAPDKEVGFRLAVAGSKGSVQIWDTSTNAAVRRIFAERLAIPQDADVQERLIGVQESDSESDSGEDVEEGEAAASDDEDEEMEG
jgi:periodic tryptophan protein 1